MNKTDRKNKTNLIVTWPSHGNLFTIKDLLASNPDFIEITLRVRVDKAIKKDKSVAIIGYKNVGKGRPTMMLSMNPVTQEFVDAAYATGIQPPEIRPLVTVMDVNVTSVSTSETSATEIPVDDTIVNPISTTVTV